MRSRSRHRFPHGHWLGEQSTRTVVMAPVCQRTCATIWPGSLTPSSVTSRIRQRNRRLRSAGVVVSACHNCGKSVRRLTDEGAIVVGQRRQLLLPGLHIGAFQALDFGQGGIPADPPTRAPPGGSRVRRDHTGAGPARLRSAPARVAAARVAPIAGVPGPVAPGLAARLPAGPAESLPEQLSDRRSIGSALHVWHLVHHSAAWPAHKYTTDRGCKWCPDAGRTGHRPPDRSTEPALPDRPRSRHEARAVGGQTRLVSHRRPRSR